MIEHQDHDGYSNQFLANKTRPFGRKNVQFSLPKEYRFLEKFRHKRS
jgi:hypothetical protein